MDDGALTCATRVVEGVEADQYACDKGHRFGVDYTRGPATEAEWPPSQELRDWMATRARSPRG
jgi:hypothetical protein